MSRQNHAGLFRKGAANPGSQSRRPQTGAGRKRGSQNKLTRDIKEAIEQSFEALGGQFWLENLARRNPSAYAQLIGKLLPLQGSGKDRQEVVVVLEGDDAKL